MNQLNNPITPGYIPRPDLLNRVLAHRNTPDIKVIIGVRRCGKSTVLAMLADALTSDGVPSQNLFYKRFDAFDIPLDYDATDLHEELIQATERADTAYPFTVMLDEIQDVPGWEKVVRRLHTRENTDVYITGSNANLLSSDLATYLTGRYIEIPTFPLSFSEYLDFSHSTKEAQDRSQDDLLADYLLYGGMPGLFALRERTTESIGAELRDIYQSILFKDVAQRYNIRDLNSLEKLSRFLFSTSGSLFSARNVANTMTSAGQSISAGTVITQVDALCRAFLLYRANQEGMQGKTVLRPLSKYYPVDNGFRGLATGFSPRDVGARLECAVYMELIRRGYTVSIGTSDTSEIDFIASRIASGGMQKQYIQVTASLLDENTRAREFAPLVSLTDAFPRIIITLDPYSAGISEEGITVVNAKDWLLRD
ncbi:ATP-binding protein [Bifidobacterium imperatoris]|uniref:AAA/ superfamily protein n=1 Tax=Bifidobacterium imperatoris TaxID=2020965 RepID=A0A2N5ITZ7_9BIFI|nr:ATP-binding protein [Bifidobacterium imperatoris]PLS25424.1 aAA/ superfamily protein [Bifidobacterium imperatoris]QSY57006.1 ATP-binding protein [Bifidobacterium imperatoris]